MITIDTKGGASSTGTTLNVTGITTTKVNELIIIHSVACASSPFTISGISGGSGLTWIPIDFTTNTGGAGGAQPQIIECWAAFSSTVQSSFTATITYFGSNTSSSASFTSWNGVRAVSSVDGAVCNFVDASSQPSASSYSASMVGRSNDGLVIYGVATPSSITVTAGAGQTLQQSNNQASGGTTRVSVITQNTANTRTATITNSGTFSSASTFGLKMMELIANDAGMVMRGTATANDQEGSTTSLVMTVGTTTAFDGRFDPMWEVPIKTKLLVIVSMNSTSPNASISDAQSNVYTLISAKNGSGGRVEVWQGTITTKLVHGNAITITLSGGSANILGKAMATYGMNSSSFVDNVTSASGSSTSLNSGTAIANQANELAVGIAFQSTDNNSFAFTANANFISIGILTNLLGAMGLYPGFNYLPSPLASPVAYTGTWNTSKSWVGIIVLLKEDAVSITSPSSSSSGTGTVVVTTPSPNTQVTLTTTPTNQNGGTGSQTPTSGQTTTATTDSNGTVTVVIPGLIPGVTYTVGVYVLDGSGNILSSAFITFTVSALIVKKRYYYKIYNTALQYVTTWSDDVVSDPTFRMIINGGAGELIVRLGRKFDNYGAGVDIVLNYRVELWCMDCDAPNGIKIFSGYISAYSPTINDEDQYLQVTILGYATRLSTHILIDKGTGDTTITYTGFDPSNIAKDAIDKFHGDGGTDVFYSNTSVQNTNTAATYTFVDNTIQEVINEVIALTPDNWFWYVDTNGIFNLNYSNIAKADHKLTIGKDIGYMSVNKRLENMVNAVSVIGGGSPNLYNYYERPASIASYGKWATRIQNGVIVDDGTSDLLAKSKLDKFDSPEYLTTLHVIDNNGENQQQGADIEQFFPGQTIQIVNLSPQPILIIQSITYFIDHIEIQAASRLPEVTKDIQTIDNILITQAQQNLPPLPVVRSV